jgi:cytochrome c553
MLLLIMRMFLALLLASLTPAAHAGDGAVEYNRDVRPILAENCFACHGPDSASRKADLRLDKREVAAEMSAIVPGKPDQSELIRRILSSDPDERMPPQETKKTLTAAQKEILRKWIAAGAQYEPHWSFIAPTRLAVPPVKNAAWPKNPIDHFVLARLEKLGLSPAPEADRRTLARRLSLDLTGLPSAPETVEAFVRDTSHDAYEKLVDHLLKSKHWGEHRARYWLDAARYADTHGIHFDNFREMWIYRDWVIAAFNRNLPFDQFTIEQLAGDLLPNATLEQKIASGFNRCNITTNEGGAIAEEYSVLYTRDRTETTSQVWLGLTTGCAVCHDHKFDPVTTKEFYSLAAFFNNTTQNAMDGNIKDTPPVLRVPRPEDRPRLESLQRDIADTRRDVESRKAGAKAEFERWLADGSRQSIEASLPQEGLKLHVPLTEGAGERLALTVDGKKREIASTSPITWRTGYVAAKAYQTQPGAIAVSEAGDFEKDQPFTCSAWVRLPATNQNGAIVARMEGGPGFRGWDLWVENGRVGSHIVRRWPNDALKVITKSMLEANQWTHVTMTYDGSRTTGGLRIYFNGAVQETESPVNRLKGSIRTKVPLKIGQRDQGQELRELILQDVRLYGQSLAAHDVRRLALGTRAAWLVSKPAKQRTPAEMTELFDGYLASQDPKTRELVTQLAALEKEQNMIQARGTVAHVMQERSERPTAHVLYRGEYDKRRDPVEPITPAALPPMPGELAKTRLGLAQWLLRSENPLTARVTVNRFWQEVFGTGLVRTAGDFGVMGELPINQELLDWLAVEFRDSGWDVKNFFRLLVTSAAYRQAAITTPEKLEKDAQNRLLSRGPRFRMDGEMVRDGALAASGLFVPKIGGPSVKPYQPEGVWEAVAMIGSNTRDYKQDSGENLYRRSLYTFWKRSAPPASMDVFNAPSREVCTVRRERTNTPLQALVTLNDIQFVEAARRLAERALNEADASDEARIDYIARRLLSRPLRDAETPIVKASLAKLSQYYASHGDDAKKLIATGESKPDPKLDPALLAAWTMLTNQLMNLDEVLNK